MAYISQYPPAHNDTYVKATSQESPTFAPYNITNPASLVTGPWQFGNTWITPQNTITNQRFHIDLGTGIIIKRIYYENLHNSGGRTGCGGKNFTFWGSNSPTAFADLVYSHDTDWTQLTTNVSQLDEHIGSNIADPKYVLVTNGTPYRYYALKIADNYGDEYLGLEHIELQLDDTPTGKFFAIKGGT